MNKMEDMLIESWLSTNETYPYTNIIFKCRCFKCFQPRLQTEEDKHLWCFTSNLSSLVWPLGFLCLGWVLSKQLLGVSLVLFYQRQPWMYDISICSLGCPLSQDSSDKWRFIGIPYQKKNNPGGDCYWVGSRPKIYHAVHGRNPAPPGMYKHL